MASMTSISILSRGVYLFWTLPYLITIIANKDFSLRKVKFLKGGFLMVFIIFAVFTLFSVSVLRAYHYTGIPNKPIADRIKNYGHYNISHHLSFLLKSKNFNQIKDLFVGRWVGLESAMATTMYPNASWEFFHEGLMEKPSVGDTGIYSSKVLELNSLHNTKNTMFSSLPGLVGILNYSNSLWLILTGTFLVGFFMCLSELIAYLLVPCKFMLSQMGLLLGYWCASGLNMPYLGLINFIECFIVILSLALMGLFYNIFCSYQNKTGFMAIKPTET
jgi:hypothetical protein